MNLILHITSYKGWVKAMDSEQYETDSLRRDGFIHCSTHQQVIGVANSTFHGEHGLVLLCIDADLVDADIKYEDCYETGQIFPHIYGPLNTDAVMQVLPLQPDTDGKFAMPSALRATTPMLRCDFPILEFDPSPEALIEPHQFLEPIDVAERCVLCFFQDVITHLKDAGRLKIIHDLGTEIGKNPLYEMDVDGQRLALCHPGVGAPLAAGFMEELIALGCRRFIICGGCGVLDGALGVGHIIVPSSAVRDEGTSYHYLPPAREVAATAAGVEAIEKVLQRDHVDYVVGKTWTTDAVYRETPDKIRLRQSEGCIAVEMEAAAFFAVARFRGVEAAQILYGGDDVSSDSWDSRHWQTQTAVRDKIFWLAAEACLEL